MRKKIKILIIEDDETGAELMGTYLRDCGFEVENAYNIIDALSFATINRYDVALLDLRLPDFSGMEFLKSIKNRLLLPVIVVSAHNTIEEKLQAFRYGAGDYMVKPIDMQELEARIWVLLGRHSQVSVPKNRDQSQKIKISGRDLLVESQQIELTDTETEIMTTLLKANGNTVSREELIEDLHHSCSARSLDNHIKNIRKKLNTLPSSKQYIKTVYGVGYRLERTEHTL